MITTNLAMLMKSMNMKSTIILMRSITLIVKRSACCLLQVQKIGVTINFCPRARHVTISIMTIGKSKMVF